MSKFRVGDRVQSMKPHTAAGMKLFMDGQKSLCAVEQAGMRVDEAYLRKAIETTNNRVVEMERELKEDVIYKEWGKRYGASTSLGSHQQLASIIYDVMGYECKIFTGEGAKRKKSCSAEALKEIDSPFVKKWLERNRLVKKVVGTYLKGLLRESVDGFVHPSQNLNLVWTYRGACANPNATNIPARDPDNAKIVREAFIPRDDHLLIETDFKANEIAAIACYNHDPAWINYVRNSPPLDMHRDCAMKLFMVDKPEDCPKMWRQEAKGNFVFAQMYGSYYLQCAEKMWEFVKSSQTLLHGVSLQEHLKKKGIKKRGKCDPRQEPEAGSFERHVKDYEKWYWGVQFPVYDKWRKDLYASFLKCGYVDLLTGFRCGGYLKRNQVLDCLPQGTGFHFLLWVITRLVKWIERNKMRSRVICQVHDSLLGDVHKDEKDDYLGKVKELVTEGLRNYWPWINVPMVAEYEVCGIGESWWHKKQIEI